MSETRYAVLAGRSRADPVLSTHETISAAFEACRDARAAYGTATIRVGRPDPSAPGGWRWI